MLSASPAAHLYAPPGGPVAADPLADASTRDRLAVLDDAQEWSAFSRTLDGRPSCWESSVMFEGMHCAACALTIEEARKTGKFTRLLITCDTRNTGSARIIETNGGILENYVISPRSGRQVSRYWVTL